MGIAVADFSGMKEVAKDVIEVLVKEHVARFFFGLRVLTYERDLLISHLVAKTLSGPPEGGEGEEGSGKKSMLAAAPRVANPHLFVILRPNYDDKRKSCWGLQWSTETVASASPRVRVKSRLTSEDASNEEKVAKMLVEVAQGIDRWSLQVAMADAVLMERDTRSFFFEQINQFTTLAEVFRDPRGIGAKYLKDYFAELELAEALTKETSTTTSSSSTTKKSTTAIQSKPSPATTSTPSTSTTSTTVKAEEPSSSAKEDASASPSDDGVQDMEVADPEEEEEEPTTRKRPRRSASTASSSSSQPEADSSPRKRRKRKK